MRLKTIYEAIDGIAPFSLSGEYCAKFGAYDNSGVMVDCGKEIEKVLFSLDCSARSVAYAGEIGADLMITHHPAIYSPLKSLAVGGGGGEVLGAVAAGISVISAHLNLDCALGGIDESLMLGLGEKAPAVMDKLSCGGYGRAYDWNGTVDSAVLRLKEKFSAKRLVVYGEGGVRRIASFCGAGLDERSLAFAKSSGADLVASSDGKHHLIAEALGQGLKVVLMTHYASENYGFQRFYERMKERLPIESAFFTDERFL